MCLDKYRAYLEGLDLTEQELSSLVEAMTAAATNIVDDLFQRSDAHELSQ